ncbi:hypothetical protein BC830DRAFT_1084674 [Chytriomyces sp. MP71]|nr:hypothetical protein BC830DRAFT_1084674 [Chytriomyces sp. MP71]
MSGGRVPPGGHSSLSLAHETPSAPAKTLDRPNPLLGGSEPAPMRRRTSNGAGLRSTLTLGADSKDGDGAGVPGMRRSASQKTTKSRIFATDEDTTPSKPGPQLTRNQTASSVLPNSTTSTEAAFIPGRRILKTANIESDTSADQSFHPSRRLVQPPTAGHFAAGISTESPVVPSALRKPVTPAASQLASTFTFGDDSPRAPDFGPKKLGKPSIKMVGSEGAAGVKGKKSLAEFTGYKDVEVGNKEAQKLDPASMDRVAGSVSGKHRVY